MEQTSPPPVLVQQGEPTSFGEYPTHLRFAGAYDTSIIFAGDFLVPHTLPTLPDFGEFEESLPEPLSPLGYKFSLTPPMLSKDLQKVGDARNTLPPPYKIKFNENDPVESSKHQLEEVQRVLGEARAALKEAYRDAYEADIDLKDLAARWEPEVTHAGPKPFMTLAFPLVGAIGKLPSSPIHSGQRVYLKSVSR